MQPSSQMERTLTQLDSVRLQKLVGLLSSEGRHDAAGEAMEEMLAVSEVLPSREIPSDLVTMHSQVMLADATTGERHKITLCYPHEADPSTGRVSVLSPVGLALLGIRCGALVQWQAPHGAASARVVEVLFQPEASGDYLS